MFTSQYLPVNIGRTNPYIRNNEKIIPLKQLMAAYDAATGQESDRAVLNPTTMLYEIDGGKLILSAEEIYLAHQAYVVAVETGFCYYAILNKSGQPTLYVSSPFAKSRAVVNAFNMHTLIVTQPALVQKLRSLIDKKVPATFTWDLFTLCHDLQTKKASYLDSLIVYRDTENAYLAVNPLMVAHAETVNCYGIDALEEIRSIVNGEAAETESFSLVDNKVVRNDLSYWPSFALTHCKNILAMYDNLLSKKSNYIPLNDRDYNTRLYISTNKRYLVHADTFQCIVVTNASVRNAIEIALKEDTCAYSDLRLIWEIAKSN